MVQRSILFLLIFCLPFQLGYHFWLPESYVGVLRIDYLAPTLYLTDILILSFLFFNFNQAILIIKKIFSTPFGVLFTALVFTNLYASSFSLVTLLGWVRVGIYFLLVTVLSFIPELPRKTRLPFLLSLTLIVLLALFQFIRQSSLGGIFYFFGERPLSVALANVAKLDFPYGQLLRPYATFSHPNSLAGYLLVSWFILRQISAPRFIRAFLIFAIFLTFSKSAILTLAIIVLIKPSLIQSVFLAGLMSLLPLLKIDPSFSSRYYLLLSAFKMITDHLFLGVGLHRFVPALSVYLPGNQVSFVSLQPVHNLLLLIIAEIGLIPLAVFFIFLFHKIKKRLPMHKYGALLTIVFLTASLDHYWWTLPQNQLIIVLALALIINKSNKIHVLS